MPFKRNNDYEYQRMNKDEYDGALEYAGRQIVHSGEASAYIKRIINSNTPAMIGRFGGNELRAMASGVFDDYPYHFLDKRHKRQELDGIFSGAGFFPRNVNLIPQFAEIMIESCREIDLLGAWFNEYEDYFISEFVPSDSKTCWLGDLEPYSDIDNPWTESLEGKRVLVVHPFEESIINQYKRRELIFPGKRVLPSFKLLTFKALQTSAGERDNRFDTWFDALNYMKMEISQIDFDIAILGCGSYGFPLAAYIKEIGKKAIHLGGPTQLLFGIMGNRWDAFPTITQMYNDAWVRPLPCETPQRKKRVEDGCYW